MAREVGARMNRGGTCVGIYRASSAMYPTDPPFHPAESYPECPLPQRARTNSTYHAVRQLFHELGYDKEHYDTRAWNPLGWIVKPGETVFIKPNFIAEKHADHDGWEHVITHGAVVRAVVDYAYVALAGRGKIIIGDGPQTDSNFDAVIRLAGIREIVSLYRDDKNFELDVLDLRDQVWVVQDGVCVDKRTLPGDPRGKVLLDLGRRSMFAPLDHSRRKYYGAFYDIEETNRHHGDGSHRYEISKSPLVADVFISIPKLKTHKKCGLTANIKGMVGLNANKNLLPHYTFGSPANGGDQFDSDRAKGRIENALVVWAKRKLRDGNPFVQRAARIAKDLAYEIFGRNDRVVRSGNWHGNDTVWRMALDLSRLLFFATPAGQWRSTPKRFLSVVDGIVAMEGNGPVAGERRELGILIGGADAAAVDAVCAAIMGFDPLKLPIIREAFAKHELPLSSSTLEDVQCISNDSRWNKPLREWTSRDGLAFAPHFAWRGHVERDRREDGARG